MKRVLLTVVALILGVSMALSSMMWWDDPGSAPRSDDDYIAIALSDPQVFRPTGPGSGRSVVPERVDRSGSVVTVDLTVDGIKFRVLIDARTDQITQVIRR